MSTENETETALRTPDEWCRIESVQVLDADGWRGRNGRDWDDPITLAEFRERLITCTQRSVALPAGEHHTGTLSLTGEGQAQDTLLTLATGWRQGADEAERYLNRAHASEIHDVYAEIRINREHATALEAAYPAIRQQVAEEIAAALDAVPAEVYPEDIFPPDGTSIDCQSARVMRFAYPAAANIAREIGGAE